MTKGGVSLPTSFFEGPNLSSSTKAIRALHRKRRRRQNGRGAIFVKPSLAAMALRWSTAATFVQIMSANDELQDEYGKCIGFDFSYARFWGDGYGKDFRVTNLKHAGVYDHDELLLSQLSSSTSRRCL